MASIKDIAKACGVSVATVSKALNGHSDISQATKEKVRQAADKLGYMPNSAARALKTNRTYNLGVLFVDDAQSGLTHEFFAAVLDSFKCHAEGRGYDITFINHNIGHGHSSYLEHCRYRGVDGVIAACVQFDDPEVVELAYSNLPLVTVDHVFNNRAAVLSDNMEGIRRLVDELAALGHERIAPDLRACGDSEGNFVGMGWLDRKDVLRWIDYIIQRDPDAEIVIHGISMGAATTMMTAGEDTPDNVKAFVEDCGYTSVWDVFSSCGSVCRNFRFCTRPAALPSCGRAIISQKPARCSRWLPVKSRCFSSTARRMILFRMK